MSWNLPDGCTDRDIDVAAGGYDEPDYDCALCLCGARDGEACEEWCDTYRPAGPIDDVVVDDVVVRAPATPARRQLHREAC